MGMRAAEVYQVILSGHPSQWVPVCGTAAALNPLCVGIVCGVPVFPTHRDHSKGRRCLTCLGITDTMCNVQCLLRSHQNAEDTITVTHRLADLSVVCLLFETMLIETWPFIKGVSEPGRICYIALGIFREAFHVCPTLG